MEQCLFHKVLLNQLSLLYHRSLPKAMIILLPLLGATWIIGIFAVNNETQVFAWIFAILNSLQISVSYCLTSYIVDIILGCLHIYITCDKK